MKKDARIFVAGSTGLVGSALVRVLEEEGYTNLITPPHGSLDLTDQRSTDYFFSDTSPEYVFLAAAQVAGIKGNMDSPVQMMTTNLAIQNNVLAASRTYGVKKLMFFGSSCIYPKLCPQPIKEDYLLTGPLEPSNECYALAKISGVKLCQAYQRQYGCNFISVMPTNLYGPNDTYKDGGHVIPDLIRKFHAAKCRQELVVVWGDGSARREFLYSDDLARACLLIMRCYEGYEPVNVGCGVDISINELVRCIADTVGLDRSYIHFDTTGPVGTPRKMLDIWKLLSFGWKPKVGLEEGLRLAYQDYLKRYGPKNGA
jgi:GDP-L-fucose synthase